MITKRKGDILLYINYFTYKKNMSINKILPPTEEKKIKKNQKEELINNLINQERYEHSNLTEKEIEQIINTLTKIDLKKDWYSKGSE